MNDTKQTKKKVFVGLSGGVDSSVAARRLVDEGHDVTGVFIKVWQPDFLSCDWEQERLDAMRVAATLNIPFQTFDAEAAYKEHVAEYMISEYRAGRTPNPDVMCNQAVKFGVFLTYALDAGADAVATGHYAQIQEINGTYQMYRGSDQEKDQTYFLWTLTQTQLQHILFPVGDSPKSSIRKEAETAGLLTATKKDSQGVCFLGQLDMRAFLQHYITEVSGEVRMLDESVIGTHEGALFYTLGQRHGITYTEQNEKRPTYYVVKKDHEQNILYVDTKKPTLAAGVLKLTDVVWNEGVPPTEPSISIQIRYRQQPISAQLTFCEGTSATIEVSGAMEMPAAGQSCVIYIGDRCLGGGIIE